MKIILPFHGCSFVACYLAAFAVVLSQCFVEGSVVNSLESAGIYYY